MEKNTPSSTTRFFLPLHTGPVSTLDPPEECSSAALGLVGLSNPDVEDIVERSAPVEEELVTLGTRFGVNPLSFQRCSVRRVGRGGAEVHEVAFSCGNTHIVTACDDVCVHPFTTETSFFLPKISTQIIFF